MQIKINFQHPYYKLDEPEFTTIRGKSWFNKVKNFPDVTLLIKGKLLCQAEITSTIMQNIGNIPLDQLKMDAEYPGYIINSHQDFLTLLNSFRASYMPHAMLESAVTIIYLKKIPPKITLNRFLGE